MATKAFEEAYSSGYEFIIGVSNQNSTHGLVNRLGFTLISQLETKIGLGNIITDNPYNYLLKSVWTEETLKWRLSNPSKQYYLCNKNFVLVPTGKLGFFAQLTNQATQYNSIKKLKNKNNPLKLWIGLGQNKVFKGKFMNLPGKLKPVPLNLIFKDLSGLNLKLIKENVYFELIDFDAY